VAPSTTRKRPEDLVSPPPRRVTAPRIPAWRGLCRATCRHRYS
jgi:hypothetical protein